MLLKRTVTRKKLDANQRNASHSTGPKTLNGKLIVSGNALKHGLFAKHLLIQKGDGKEDLADFDALLQDFHEEWQPVGRREARLVEKMAICDWRYARVLRYEAGQIRANVDSLDWDETHRLAEEFAEEEYRMYMSAALPDVSAAISLKQECDEVERKFNQTTDADALKGLQGLLLSLLSLRKSVCAEVENFERRRLLLKKQRSARGIEELLSHLKSLLNEIETAKSMETVRRSLDIAFLGRIEFYAVMRSSSVLLDSCLVSGDEENAKRLRDFMIKISNREREQLEQELEGAKNNETLSREAKLLSRSLPATEISELVMRLITSIDREFSRACNQLERLQRLRKGEPVPAPASISVN